MIASTFALAGVWVRIYTRGVGAALRDARRAEIAWDLWEQRHDERVDGRRAIVTAGPRALIMQRLWTAR